MFTLWNIQCNLYSRWCHQMAGYIDMLHIVQERKVKLQSWHKIWHSCLLDLDLESSTTRISINSVHTSSYHCLIMCTPFCRRHYWKPTVDGVVWIQFRQLPFLGIWSVRFVQKHACFLLTRSTGRMALSKIASASNSLQLLYVKFLCKID